ncbi:MAG: hypothetical protein ACRETO_00615 [Gammaproteobacteria bacterium]
MDSNNKYWFRAKQYGWGWSLPISWQGWVVAAAYAASLVLIFRFLPPVANTMLFLCGVLASSAILLLVCVLKGEPTKWRWGKK